MGSDNSGLLKRSPKKKKSVTISHVCFVHAKAALRVCQNETFSKQLHVL